MRVQSEKGFTLIELVVVIVILGILSAVAVPKFVALQKDAHKASVQGASAALAAGVTMAKSKWLILADNTATDIDLDGDGTDDMKTTTSGWVIGTDGTLNDEADCVAIWNNLLETNAPQAATDTTADYQAAFTAPTCSFTYNADNTFSISYNTSTGVVTAP